LAIVEAARRRFGECPLHVGVEAAGLGVGWRHVASRPAKGGKADGSAPRLRHGHFVEEEDEVGRFGDGRDKAATGEDHRADIELGRLREALDAFAAEVLDLSRRQREVQEHGLSRAGEALAMAVEIGGEAVEGTCTVEDDARHEEGVVERRQDAWRLVIPAAVIPDERRHSPISVQCSVRLDQASLAEDPVVPMRTTIAGRIGAFGGGAVGGAGHEPGCRVEEGGEG
jgi:hypothetical protein